MALKPPDTEGGVKEHWLRSLLRSFVRQLRWLVFGIPKSRRRGRWVYNSQDQTWRYYLDDVEYR